MIQILQIDTSADDCTVILGRDGKVALKKTTTGARNHAASINLMISDLMEEAGISFEELNAVSVIAGPGSYTGLRIGLATAKAFCYVHDLPLIMHNRLTLLAEEQIQKSAGEYEVFVSVFPAREKESFIAALDNKGEYVKNPLHVMDDELEKILGSFSSKLLVTGRLSSTTGEIMTKRNMKIIQNEVIAPELWTAISYEDFDCKRFVNLAEAEPYYLKHVYTHKKL
jgi:tRNA threonylcarbamoyladenosine biosynthesis protein TsaB